MKKLLLLLLSGLLYTAAAQEKTETIIYVDGVETKTVSYMVDGYSILDIYTDGKLTNSTREKDGITITGNLEIYKAYGQYVAFNIVITNNTSDTFNFLPKKHLIASAYDNKGKSGQALTYEEYNTIVKRRQNGNAFLMALATGVNNANAGTSVYGTSGNIGGTRFNSTTVSYNSTLASIERDRNNARLGDFVAGQAASLSAAKDAYLKANTIAPGQTVAGHILIKTRGVSKKNMAVEANIFLNNVEFNYKKRFIK